MNHKDTKDTKGEEKDVYGYLPDTDPKLSRLLFSVLCVFVVKFLFSDL